MKWLKSVFRFYISSSVHVALAVFSMTYVSLLEFNLGIDWNLLWFVFFSTIAAYNFVKYYGVTKFHYRSLTHWLRFTQIITLISFVVAIFYASRLSSRTLIYCVGFAMVTFMYAVPFLPKRYVMDRKKNLRNIGGLKVYVIALVWGGVTVLLPILDSSETFNLDVWIAAVQRFIFVMMLMLPFEIRDLQYDSIHLATIPQKIGIRNTKIIGIFMGFLFVLLEFTKSELTLKLIVLTGLIAVITLLFILFSTKNRSDYYCSFYVESVPILWLGFHLVF